MHRFHAVSVFIPLIQIPCMNIHSSIKQRDNRISTGNSAFSSLHLWQKMSNSRSRVLYPAVSSHGSHCKLMSSNECVGAMCVWIAVQGRTVSLAALRSLTLRCNINISSSHSSVLLAQLTSEYIRSVKQHIGQRCLERGQYLIDCSCTAVTRGHVSIHALCYNPLFFNISWAAVARVVQVVRFPGPAIYLSKYLWGRHWTQNCSRVDTCWRPTTPWGWVKCRMRHCHWMSDK